MDEDVGNASKLIKQLVIKIYGNLFNIPKYKEIVKYVRGVILEKKGTEETARIIMEIANCNKNLDVAKKSKKGWMETIKEISDVFGEGLTIKEGNPMKLGL